MSTSKWVIGGQKPQKARVESYLLRMSQRLSQRWAFRIIKLLQPHNIFLAQLWMMASNKFNHFFCPTHFPHNTLHACVLTDCATFADFSNREPKTTSVLLYHLWSVPDCLFQFHGSHSPHMTKGMRSEVWSLEQKGQGFRPVSCMRSSWQSLKIHEPPMSVKWSLIRREHNYPSFVTDLRWNFTLAPLNSTKQRYPPKSQSPLELQGQRCIFDRALMTPYDMWCPLGLCSQSCLVVIYKLLFIFIWFKPIQIIHIYTTWRVL